MNYSDLVAEIKQEFPEFNLVAKADSRFMGFLDIVLRVVTLDHMTAFMGSYTTTIGTTVYTPLIWPSMTEQERKAILRHERVHMRQAKKYGRLLFSFLYLFAFFPLGLAYYRAKFEQEAYEESMRAMLEYAGPQMLRSSIYRAYMVGHFVDASYGWMWPFRKQIEAWYDSTAAKLLPPPVPPSA